MNNKINIPQKSTNFQALANEKSPSFSVWWRGTLMVLVFGGITRNFRVVLILRRVKPLPFFMESRKLLLDIGDVIVEMDCSPVFRYLIDQSCPFISFGAI